MNISTDNIFDEEMEMETDLTIYQASKIANEYFDEIRASDASDLYSYNKLVKVIEGLLLQDEISGDANDFHNFSVELARENHEQLAFKLIEKGLDKFPNNIDLLSDYLQYGILVGKQKECNEVLERLMRIPSNRWSWRGFSYSINYLQHLLDDMSESEAQIIEIKDRIEKLVNDYIKYFPYSEDGYKALAKVYSSIKDDPEREVEILKKCMISVKVCPKCALRSADIYFERGEFDKALENVEKAIRDANQTQGSINEGYLYYLSGLCKMSKLGLKAKKEISDDEIVSIYLDFDSAFLEFGHDIDDTYKVVMIKKSKMLRNRYHIEIPDTCEKLLENLDE